MTPYHIAFVAVALYSTSVQVRSYALRELLDTAPDLSSAFRTEYASLARKRRIMTPFIGGLTALLVAMGTFVYDGPSLYVGALLTAVWVLAATGDIFIEGSYAAEDDAGKARYYMIGMTLFVAVTLGLGVGLMINALVVEGIEAVGALVSVGISIGLAVLAYRTLDVSPETLVIVLVYSVSVATLLCGGLLSAINGHPHLAYIGIAYFISDWCVGLRDFGKRPPAWLKRNALIIILILYYTTMLTSIDYAFSSSLP
jgi:hypothetical protein